jgi:hypothetical protein
MIWDGEIGSGNLYSMTIENTRIDFWSTGQPTSKR